MITSLQKGQGICFDCYDFLIMHSEIGYEIKWRGDKFKPVSEQEALRMANSAIRSYLIP